MWTYNNTDELYHTDMYKNMNKKLNHELYHSNVYLGKDFSDGIKHFKYIKREKINGKWRYYYKDDKLDALKKERDNLYSKYQSAKLGSFERDQAMKKYVFKDQEYNSKNKKSNSKKAKYEKYLINPLNKVSDKIYNGKQKISDLINKLKKKKK